MTEILISEAAKVAAHDLSTRIHGSDGDHRTTEALVAKRIQQAINVEVAARDARLADLVERLTRVKANAEATLDVETERLRDDLHTARDQVRDLKAQRASILEILATYRHDKALIPFGIACAFCRAHDEIERATARDNREKTDG